MSGNQLLSSPPVSAPLFHLQLLINFQLTFVNVSPRRRTPRNLFSINAKSREVRETRNWNRFWFPPNRLVAAILQLDTYFMERGAVTLEL